MQIVEISEPGESQATDTENLIVGIDFGTTNSLIAISENHQAIVIPDANGNNLIKSIVQFNDITFSSVKRLFGKNRNEVENSLAFSTIIKQMLDKNHEDIKLNIDSKLFSPVEIAAKIFIHLKNNAEKYLGRGVEKAVVTVPAYFDDAAKGQTLLAAKLAGFNVLRLLAEPTAAAYAYGINKKVQGCYAVYDLGGGTFDISVLNITQGVIQVVALGGDSALGGDDIDWLIKEFLVQQYKLPDDNELLSLAKNIKETLSYQEKFTHEVEEQNITIEIDKDIFNRLILSLIQHTIKITEEVFEQVDGAAIEAIILVGGSSRIPLITKLLQQVFNIKILSDVNPEKIVAIGAALQAENLRSKANTLLIDALPLSLGLELYGGVVEKIITRNTALPVSATKQYTTQVDNQNAMEFHVLQGEREFAKDCRSLAYFELNDLPLAKAGGIKIEVTFALDVDGILSVSALDAASGKYHIMEVKPGAGLNQQEVDNILDNAYKNATLDHHNMLLQEKIIRAESLIHDLQNVLANMNNILMGDERQKIMQVIKLLEQYIGKKDYTLITQTLEELEHIINESINSKLYSAIASQLKGKSISEF